MTSMEQRRTVRQLAAAACACAWASQAPAQENVTIYGLFDLAMVKKSGGGTTALERGNNNRLGFRGTEDLGGGLRATFHIQHRFRPDTGAVERAAVFWQGESTVGLSSDTWGTLRLGRGTTPIWQKNWAFEPWGASGFNASLAAFHVGNFTFSSDGTNDATVGSANSARSPNTVFYNSPVLAGFSAAVSAQIEKDAGAQSRNRGISLNYDRGPVALMLGGEENTDRDRMAFAAASYAFDGLKLMGSYARIDHDDAPSESSYVVAATYTLARAGTLRAGFGRNADVGVKKLSLGYVHPLSRRTSLYVDGWRQETRTAADTFNAIALGISHSF